MIHSKLPKMLLLMICFINMSITSSWHAYNYSLIPKNIKGLAIFVYITKSTQHINITTFMDIAILLMVALTITNLPDPILLTLLQSCCCGQIWWMVENYIVIFIRTKIDIDTESGETLYGSKDILEMIHKNQNPDSCENAKFIISSGWPFGFGTIFSFTDFILFFLRRFKNSYGRHCIVDSIKSRKSFIIPSGWR